jgi:hypothetical protein
MFSGNINNIEQMKNINYSKKSSTSLTQGEKFMKYQKKIKHKTKTMEGFTSDYSGFSSKSLTAETKKILDKSKLLTNAKAETAFSEYENQYNSALGNLEFQETGGSLAINDYYARINPKNPYLNTNIAFTDGTIAYVTNQGVVKMYPSSEIFIATAGMNGCPSSKNITQLKFPWVAEYNSPGITIPTKPPLITGTPMTQGQSCGHEGTNVYVNTILNPNVKTKFQGCYADNAETPAMTYVGPAPPEPFNFTAPLQNPNFDYPQIPGNTYEYIVPDSYDELLEPNSTAITVPGWFFQAVLANNSEAWGFPMPYPYGNQAAVIQNVQSISQMVNMPSIGTYTLTVYAVGRPSPNYANEIAFFCGAGYVEPQSAVQGAFTPGQTSWEQFSFSLDITSTGMWSFGFFGLGDGGGGGGQYYATAIQNISIVDSGVTSGGGGGYYTADMCKEYAIYNGYQYYAIQDANSSGVGYCAVSNDLISATQYGKSLAPTAQVDAWSSNTSGQPGNTATLNISGSLVVMNSSGTTVYSTPNNSNYPANYLGCYADDSSRTFSNALSNGQVYAADANNYSWNYSVQTCQQAAQANNMSYFGLQDSTIEGEAVCFIGNTNGTQLGPATNCTQFSDGTVNGGSWSNAVYLTSPGNVNYFLSVSDQGVLGIYLGQNPNDNQGTIWSFSITPQDANPNYVASNGISGQNWIATGTTLAPGDFVGSPSGYCALIMQTDGNLTFTIFRMASNCATINGSEVGNLGANAIYALDETGDINGLGQVAYIDQNSTLYPYDSNNVAPLNTYTKIDNFDSSGNNLPNSPIANSTVEQCQAVCDSNDECYGFSIINGSCYPKNNQMYPNTPLTINTNSTLYMRNQSPMVAPFGVQPTATNINSNQYKNYAQNGETVSNSGASINGSGGQFNLINPAKSPALQKAEKNMNSYADGLNKKMNKFNKVDIALQNQSTINVNGIKNGLTDLKEIQKKIQNFNLSTSEILDVSDITVLQKNYNYMFWSILAIGTVIASMHVSKF